MKPIIKRAFYVIAAIAILICANLILKEAVKNYDKCISYMATNIVSRS